jgi:hypothetical protein
MSIARMRRNKARLDLATGVCRTSRDAIAMNQPIEGSRIAQPVLHEYPKLPPHIGSAHLRGLIDNLAAWSTAAQTSC